MPYYQARPRRQHLPDAYGDAVSQPFVLRAGRRHRCGAEFGLNTTSTPPPASTSYRRMFGRPRKPGAPKTPSARMPLEMLPAGWRRSPRQSPLRLLSVALRTATARRAMRSRESRAARRRHGADSPHVQMAAIARENKIAARARSRFRPCSRRLRQPGALVSSRRCCGDQCRRPARLRPFTSLITALGPFDIEAQPRWTSGDAAQRSVGRRPEFRNGRRPLSGGPGGRVHRSRGKLFRKKRALAKKQRCRARYPPPYERARNCC